MKKWHVEVWVQQGGMVGILVECLRYAGIVTNDGLVGGPVDHYGFRMSPPRGYVNQEYWAKSNAERIRSFGRGITATAKVD